MLVVTVWRAWQWLESVEDQVPADVLREVQTSKSDLTARGITIGLLEAADRVGPTHKATEHKNLSRKENLRGRNVTIDEEVSY